MNKYIIGDNLHILETLKTNKVQVDLIYFDPPYNTGRDFNDFDDLDDFWALNLIK